MYGLGSLRGPYAPSASPSDAGGYKHVEIDWSTIVGPGSRATVEGEGRTPHLSDSAGSFTGPVPSPPPRAHPSYSASNVPDPLFTKCMELSLWTSPIPGVRIMHDAANRRRTVFANRAAYSLFGATERLVVEFMKAKRSLIWLHPQVTAFVPLLNPD